MLKFLKENQDKLEEAGLLMPSFLANVSLVSYILREVRNIGRTL